MWAAFAEIRAKPGVSVLPHTSARNGARVYTKRTVLAKINLIREPSSCSFLLHAHFLVTLFDLAVIKFSPERGVQWKNCAVATLTPRCTVTSSWCRTRWGQLRQRGRVAGRCALPGVPPGYLLQMKDPICRRLFRKRTIFANETVSAEIG